MNISEQFEDHASRLQRDLAMHTNRVVANANQALSDIHTDLRRLMRLIFENLNTREEREISEFVSSKGGRSEVLKNDTLLGDLLRQQPEPATTKSQRSREPDDKSILDEVRKEAAKDLAKVLKENRKTFEQKFDAQRLQIEEVRDTVVKEGDRIIYAITSGPHGRIVNKVSNLGLHYPRTHISQDIYFVWKENVGRQPLRQLSGLSNDFIQHWKTSVKAVHLVMALHDYFSPSRANLLERSYLSAETAGNQESRVAPKDQWALQYIGLHLLRPLIEAIDGDVSSFVTIDEVNEFTAARPADWRFVRHILPPIYLTSVI